MTWGVTISDVTNTTGTTPTAADLAAADSIITVYINRTPDASGGISGRDLTWIRTAIQWQAAWVNGNPDTAGASQYDSYSSDGLSIQTTAEWAKVLAPIAARSLKNLTWKGTRTQRTPPVRQGRGLVLDFLNEESDDYSGWSGL
jgi:hypothetical protein